MAAGCIRNEFERYVVQYDVPVRSHHELPLRTGDERPGDVMIQHDMSTCILCTRCVRACEDIQEVGVLDVGHAGRACPDHRGRRRRSRSRRLHLVRRMRPRLSHRRHLRVHSQAAFRRGGAPRPGPGGPLGLSLLRRRLPDRPPRQGRRRHAGHLALDRGGHAQPGLHLREGPLRLRLSPAPRPAHRPLIRKGWM